MLVDVKKKKVIKERLLTPEDALAFIKDDYIKKKIIKNGYKSSVYFIRGVFYE